MGDKSPKGKGKASKKDVKEKRRDKQLKKAGGVSTTSAIR
jgi:hypothetical protein